MKKKVKNWLNRFFGLEELGTDVRTEVVAGITTFMTMAYIIVVNPKILQVAGIPFGPFLVIGAMVAPIWGEWIIDWWWGICSV